MKKNSKTEKQRPDEVEEIRLPEIEPVPLRLRELAIRLGEELHKKFGEQHKRHS